MAVRDQLIAAAAAGFARPFVAGPTALYAAWGNLPSSAGAANAVLNARSDSNTAVLSTSPQDDFSATFRTYFKSGTFAQIAARLTAYYQNIAFVGWAERVPIIRSRPAYKPWHTDRGGSAHGHDYWYMGAEAYVSADLTVWNEAAYALMQSYSGDFFRGQDLPGEVGTWMGAEGRAYQLFLVFPYQAKSIYSPMPPGYRFVAAMLQDDAAYNGSTARKLRLIWHCIRLYNPLDQTYTLYDHNIFGLPNVSATTAVPQG